MTTTKEGGSVRSPARRASLARKTDKLLRLFEDHVFVSYTEKTAKTNLRVARVFLFWLEEQGISLIEARTADIEA